MSELPDARNIAQRFAPILEALRPFQGLEALIQDLVAIEQRRADYQASEERLKKDLAKLDEERERRREGLERLKAEIAEESNQVKEQLAHLRMEKEAVRLKLDQELETVKDDVRHAREDLLNVQNEQVKAEGQLERIRAEVAKSLESLGRVAKV